VRRRFASAIVRLALAALLLPFALDWRSPILTSVRPFALAGFILVPSALIVAGILALRPPARPLLRALQWLALLMAALSLVFALTPEIRFRLLRHQVLNADAAALQKLGRHLIVGYRDLDEIQELIRHGAIAGVFISATNVRGLSAPEVKHQIAAMQEIRRDQHLPPLWIATDQEGGEVARLSPPLPRPPRLSEILAHYPGRSDGIAAVQRSAREQAASLPTSAST
jgi:beta-N-acetylhexosaminidase